MGSALRWNDAGRCGEGLGRVDRDERAVRQPQKSRLVVRRHNGGSGKGLLHCPQRLACLEVLGLS